MKELSTSIGDLGFVKVHKPVTHITNQLQKIRVATM
jgi:hypothetical protein